MTITLKNHLNYHEAPIYLSVATTAFPLGCLISSIFYQKLASSFGESKLMKICDLSVILIQMIQLVSLDIKILIELRFLLGLTIGISGTAVPSYLISIAPTSMSGRIGSLNQIFITIGIAVGYAMGFIMSNT